MYIIESDEILRKYLPNAFTTVEGEASFYDKLLPWLQAAEAWLGCNIVGWNAMSSILGNEKCTEYLLLHRLAVEHAFKSAIPSLDLVLTPNGFGIVSNQNVAPASKERIERLIAELRDSIDNDLEQLLNLLPNWEEWSEDDGIYSFWRATLFPNISVARMVPQPQDDVRSLYGHFLRLRPRIIAIEHHLEEEYFSHNLMGAFRMMLCTDPMGLEDIEREVVELIRAEIIDMLCGNRPNRENLVRIVNIIRNNPDTFVLWHQSDTAKLFSPPVFENKKHSTGYWF